MSRLGKPLRRRELARKRRDLDRAIAAAPTPAMRDELIVVAERQGLFRTR
jgi:hypothetical protein